MLHGSVYAEAACVVDMCCMVVCMQIAEAACDVDMCCMVVCMQKLHVFLTCVAW